MSDDIKTPGTGGEISDATRKAVNGWHAIMEGKKQGKSSTQIKQEQRILIKENQKPETQYRPGDEEQNEGFSARKAKAHMQKLFEEKQSQKIFKGNAQQLALKLQILTEGDAERNISGGHKVKVISCEEDGLGMYKLTYLLTD